MTARPPRTRTLRPAALLLGLAFLPGAGTPQEPPVFPRRVDLVVVDAVVTDKAGGTVGDLAREDFTVLEDGVPHAIESFQAVRLPEARVAVPAPEAPADAAGIARPRIATNDADESLQRRGRFFLIVFDNLHTLPLNATGAKAAIRSFLDEGVGEGDTVTLVPTGSGPWWTARMPAGRADLLAVLDAMQGERPMEPAGDRITDWEAMRVYLYQDALVGDRILRRWESWGMKGRVRSESERAGRAIYMPGQIDLTVEARAAETFLKMQGRSRVVLGLLVRAMNALADTRERKTVILVSDGFVLDPSDALVKDVVEASRRANAPVYFLDARGLQSLSFPYSAEYGARIDERDMMAAIADVSHEADGSELLAQETGGLVLLKSNDLDGALVQVGRESRAYYLLGYTPANAARDGRYRKIEVKVRRKGLVVRARRGYYAPSESGTAVAPKVRGADPDLQRAFDSPLPLSDLPLRMAAYVAEPTSLGRSRVLFAADVDVSRLTLAESNGRRTGTLDVLMGVAHRDSPEVLRSDQEVELEPKAHPGGGPAWYSIVRDFELASGTWRAKLVVRDAASKAMGTVTLEIDVPKLDTLWVSTPILTDVIQRGADQTSFAPVLLARRTFPTGGLLYCRFDVFGAASDPATGRPRVSAGHVLRRVGGLPISSAEPSRIEPTSVGALVRALQIPLFRAQPGEYELRIEVVDEVSGQRRLLEERFEVGAPRTAGGA